MTKSPYRALIDSSSRLEGISLLEDLSHESIDDANILLERIRPILDETQAFVWQNCKVPVDFNPNFFSYHSCDLKNLRDLARAFRFAAEVAAFNRDFITVARYGILMLDLANATRRGGLIVDHLVAVAISGSGQSLLRSFRDRFDDNICTDLIAALDRFERERETYNEIAIRDSLWEAQSGYVVDAQEVSEDELVVPDSEVSMDLQRAMIQLVKELASRPKTEIEAMRVAQDHHDLAIARLLSIDLAIRSWKNRNGRYPETISDLTPDFLLTVPRDPFTDAPFIYRSARNHFQLYSTGPDQTDSGGRFGPWFAVIRGGYDLCLDSEDYGYGSCSTDHRPGLLHRIWSKLVGQR